MTSPDDRMAEIQRGEHWFREVCVDPDGPDMELIKQRSVIELNEQWLGDRIRDDPPADLAGRLKQRISAAVAMQTQHRLEPSFRAGSVWPWGRVLRSAGIAAAVAAVLVLAFVGLGRSGAGGPEFSALAAFEAFDEDDLFRSLSGLDEEIAELELAFDTPDTRELSDELYRELFDEVHSIMDSNELSDDRS